MTLFCIKMLITLSHERKITFFKYTFFAFQHHFCFCFTLEVEGVPIFLRRGYIHCEIFLSKHFMKYVFYNSFHRVNCREYPWYTFWDNSWNIKILKIDFQNFLYRERLSYWICFHAWLIILLSMTSSKI